MLANSLSKVTQEVENNFKLHVPNFSHKKYLILFSGGMDSVLLTEIMASLISPNNLFLLYCHYHLREKENILENDLLKKIATTKKIPYFLHKESLEKYSKNRQAQARKIRFTAARKIKEQYAIDFLVTAHHADDFLETFFLKMLAGNSPQNLISMLPFKKNDVLRPLRDLEKKTILALVKKNNFSYVEDSSNQKNTYQRNYLRNALFPLLNERFPDWKKNITLFSEHLQEYTQLAQKKLQDWGVIKEKTIFLKKVFFHLSPKSRITLLHYFFTLVYPAKRFSKNFFITINQKIADGKNSKTLATIHNKKVVYSYSYIAEEIPSPPQVLLANSFFCLNGLNDMVVAFNLKKLNPEKRLKQIVIAIPFLEKVAITSLPLLISVATGAKKTILKKLLSNNKIPQMMRNSLLGVFQEKKLLAILNPYYFLGIEKLNLLIEKTNNNLEKKDREVTIAYLG